MRFIRNLQTLVPLHEHTEAIGLSDDGKVEIRTRLNPPIDEFGIPRPEIMMRHLLAQMNTENYVWPGQFDEHHLATPKADFTVVRTPGEGDIGSAFRGLACLKIDVPRQMHNFSHAIYALPGRPAVDVMRQAVAEVGQAKQLLSIMNEHLPFYPHKETDRMKRLCLDALQTALERMREPEVGMLPALEELANMELDAIRVTINSLLRVRRFSKKHLIHPAIRKPQQQNAIRTAA